MLNQIVKLQGFAQGVLKGPPDVLPSSVVVGPNQILKLVNGKDADGRHTIESTFEFVTPNPDLQGSREHLEMLLANFLTARGIDPSLVSGSAQAQKYNSGIERLLSMVEQFEASRDDYALYRNVEESLYHLVKAWHNVSLQSDLLLPEYKSTTIPETSVVSPCYASPEMIKTEKEQLEIWQLKEEMGVASRVDAIMELYGVDRDAAVEKLSEIQKDSVTVYVKAENEDEEDEENETESESVSDEES
jgi:hypothetical protein